MSDDIQKLKERIRGLQDELSLKEQDVALYQKEITNINIKIEEALTRLNNNLSCIQEVYKALVPTEIPNIPGFEFSNKFIPSSGSGGDYFDVFEHIDKSRFGMLLTSASSYVMSGLVLSTLLKLNTEMKRGLAPDKFMQSINKECSQKIKGSDFFSIFYSFFDRRDYKLNYFLAGDILALFYCYEKGDLKLIPPNLDRIDQGVSLDNSKASGVLQLGPRDRLIFCSPGVFSSTNLKGESFGSERLFQVVVDSLDMNVHELRNNILYSVDNFISEAQKDMTVVVAEVGDKVIRLA